MSVQEKLFRRSIPSIRFLLKRSHDRLPSTQRSDGREWARRAIKIFLFVLISFSSKTSFADLVLGSGTEATWLYNPFNGNLQFRIENGDEYTGLVLRTNLAHIDSTAPDFSNRFLLSDHPGFNGPFSVVSEVELAFFVLVGGGAACPDCLRDTTDFGQVIVPSLTTTEIIENWSTFSSIRPIGGTDSTTDPTAFGIVAVPEPSPLLIGCLISISCGLVAVARRKFFRSQRS